MTDKDTTRLAEIESLMRARIAEHLFHMEPLKQEKRAILNRIRQRRFRAQEGALQKWGAAYANGSTLGE